MVTFQSQVIQGKEVFLKKINSFTILFFIILFLSNLKASEVALEERQNIVNYFVNFKELSASFMQTDNVTIEKGNLFIQNEIKRIIIQYSSPSKIKITISKNKGMYFNEDLQEVTYFKPKKTSGDFFYELFFNKDFFDNAVHKKDKNVITIKKKIYLEGIESTIKIYFENNPMVIRKIEINKDNKITTFSIFDLNFNPLLDEKFFNMVNPLIN